MSDSNVINDPVVLSELAKDLGASDRSRAILERFLSGEKGARMPQELSEHVDHASSLIVVPGTQIKANILVTDRIKDLGLIVRDGLTAPFVHGRGLGLRSNIVTDPLLQRTGCLPVCTDAAIQNVIQLLAEIPEMEWLDGLPEEDWECAKAASELGAKLRKWARTKGTRVPEYLVKDIQRCSSISLDGNAIKKMLRALHANRDIPCQVSSDSALNPLDRYTAFHKAADIILKNQRHLGTERIPQASKATDPTVLIQGAGDLSFNEWTVALFRPSEGSGPQTFIPEGEPFSRRRYRCLVHWKPDHSIPSELSDASNYGLGDSLGDELAMLELEFSPGRVFLPPFGAVNRTDITDSVEFAVFGKSVLWDVVTVQM